MKLGRIFNLDLKKVFCSIEVHCGNNRRAVQLNYQMIQLKEALHFDENVSKMATWVFWYVGPHTSWKHKIFQVGRDLCQYSSPTSSSKHCWFCNQIRLLRTWSSRWTFHSLPGQLVPLQCLSILIMKSVFLVFSENYFASTYCHGLFFFMMQLCEGSALVFSVAHHQVVKESNQIFPKPALFESRQIQVSQPLLTYVLQSPTYRSAALLYYLHLVNTSFKSKGSTLDKARCGLQVLNGRQ